MAPDADDLRQPSGTLLILADARYNKEAWRRWMEPWMAEALKHAPRRDLAVDVAIDLAKKFYRSQVCLPSISPPESCRLRCLTLMCPHPQCARQAPSRRAAGELQRSPKKRKSSSEGGAELALAAPRVMESGGFEPLATIKNEETQVAVK